MDTAGKAVVRPGGKRGVLVGGKAAVFDSEGQCPACCCCFEGTTLEYLYLRWGVDYSDSNCHTAVWELRGEKVNVVLMPLWTEEDQTDYGVWEGIGQRVEGHSDADNPYEQHNGYEGPLYMQIRWREVPARWETRDKTSAGASWSNWHQLLGIGEDADVERSDCGGYLWIRDVSCSPVDQPGATIYHKGRQIREITVVPPLP